MKSEKTIKILDSWTISGFGIIVEVENIHDGLPKGTILKSQETKLTWIVKSRIVETLSIDELTRFPNETETPIHLNLKNRSNLEKTKERIVERNLNRIFQYHLKPNAHNEKPKNDQKLTIEQKEERMPIEIILCANVKENEANSYIDGLKWSLDRYLKSEESEIRRAIKPMTLDLGNGIKIDLVIDLMNSHSCFDFDYEPVEKDRLLISNVIDNKHHKYFGLIFRNGKWKKGDYYTTKIPYKGTKVISERIREGKIKTTPQQQL